MTAAILETVHFELGEARTEMTNGAASGPTSVTVENTDGQYSTYYTQATFGSSDTWQLDSREDAFTADAAGDPIVVGFAFRVNDPAADWSNLRFFVRNGGTSTSDVFLIADINSDGSITMWGSTSFASSSTSFGTSASGLVQADTWHWLSLRFVADDTNGEADVYLDGAEVVTYSGDTWISSFGSPADDIGYGIYCNTSSVSTTPIIDVGLIVFGKDQAIFPIMEVEACVPDSTGSPADGTVTGAASAHAALSDIPVDDTSYVELSTSGDKQVQGFEARTNTGTIRRVELWGHVSDPLAGNIDANGFIISGSTELDGSTISLSSTAAQTLLVATEDDPDSGTTMTTSEFDALEAGFERST